DCVEQGYLLVPAALQTLMQGDVATASEMFERAIAIASRFEDHDLQAMGRLGRGQSLIGLGDVAAGVAYFDETKVSLTTCECSPIIAGVIYCAVIEGCRAIFALRRAHEGTEAW